MMKIYKAVKCEGRTVEGEPGTITVEKNRLFVTTADGQLEIVLLQLAGKKRMEASAFLNGRSLDGAYFSKEEVN